MEAFTSPCLHHSHYLSSIYDPWRSFTSSLLWPTPRPMWGLDSIPELEKFSFSCRKGPGSCPVQRAGRWRSGNRNQLSSFLPELPSRSTASWPTVCCLFRFRSDHLGSWAQDQGRSGWSRKKQPWGWALGTCLAPWLRSPTVLWLSCFLHPKPCSPPKGCRAGLL